MFVELPQEAIAIPDPARYFAESFQQVLTEVGIQVDQLEMVSHISLNNQDKLLLEISSPTIQDLITETNQLDSAKFLENQRVY